MDGGFQSPPDGWGTNVLADLLTALTEPADEPSAIRLAAERVAEALDAEIAAILQERRLLAAVGLGEAAQALVADLSDVVAGRRDHVELPGVSGSLHAASVPIGRHGTSSLVVARASQAFAPAELSLLHGLGRVVTQGLELRGRQELLERLAQIQRAIVAQRALHEVLDAIVESLAELLGDEVVILRVGEPGSPERAEVVASTGASHDLLSSAARAPRAGLGARAALEGRVVVSSEQTEVVPAEWAAEGLHAGMAAPVFSRGEIVGSVGVASRRPDRDYSAREQQVLASFAEHVSLALNHASALDDIAHQAFHDALTGLPNRDLFLDRVAQSLARSERSGRPVGVLFVDLDDFKTVNDSLGHHVGDDLLRQVTNRFAACLRPADTLARLGGDEFAVLLDEIRDPYDAAQAAERLLAALDEPIVVEGRPLYAGASIGIATGPGAPETLLRDADLAMYRAKADGKRRHRMFEPGMHTAAVERLELGFDLNRAIERGELELAYQPIFSMSTGGVAGMEALLRWQHPERGLVAPERFIPVAEESGAIGGLGRWVLRSACHQGALWRARYPGMPGLQVGVNVSAAQLAEPGLVGDVAEALEAAQLDPEGLTLEVTETALMHDLDAAARRLAELKLLGVQVAVDDFGIGHSSLRYLKQLPLDNLKIAQPFVDEIGRPEAVPPILRTVIELASVLGLRPVAEGVERPEQQFTLLQLGCELGQGHLLSEPLPASEADDLILRVGLLGGPAAQREPRRGTPFRRSRS